MDSRAARLILEDGRAFEGARFGADADAAGEVVFNTGMVGYPEALTDPSYRGQILVLTYPLVGNYGVPALERDEHGLPVGFESDRIQAAGLVICREARRPSHHRCALSLDEWMREQGVPGLSGVDTRALTRHLRSRGAMLGGLTDRDRVGPLSDPNTTDLVAQVSPRRPRRIAARSDGGDRPSVVLLDCGCKASISRALLERGVDVTVVPHDHYFPDLPFDGLVLSNGPGDPATCRAAVRHVGHALALGKPILGICLGHQILARAAGAETYKLPYGHRGQNQPCLEHRPDAEERWAPSRRCHITSQNHGYAVRAETLPPDWRVWFTNANDGTVEGIRHVTRPFLGVQFHPEARPGPSDTHWIFDELVDAIRRDAR